MIGPVRLVDVELPDGVELVRSTAEFDETSTPPGLLASHRIAAGVWGRLVVMSGALAFEFDDGCDARKIIIAGDHQIIPPQREHCVELLGAVVFRVEFYRRPAGLSADASPTS